MSINGFSDRALAKKQYNDNSDAAKPSNNPIPANTPGLFLHATRSSVKKSRTPCPVSHGFFSHLYGAALKIHNAPYVLLQNLMQNIQDKQQATGCLR